jgi:schlafen family protein
VPGDVSYPERSPHAGWSSDIRHFREAAPAYVRSSLEAFVRDATTQQIRAWDDSIPPLQREANELVVRDRAADGYSAILEYRLPMEYRRPDVVLLLGGPVLVLELKGKSVAERVDIDQAAAYARDLRGYHRECADRSVHSALVLTRAVGHLATDSGVEILGPDALDGLADRLTRTHPGVPIRIERFLDPAAYRPLPSLVEAARQLLERGEVQRIGAIDEKTRPTLDLVSNIAREAARTKTRRLILLTGLPGTGKTLIGLQLAHSRFLDDIAVQRADGKPSAPAVYLSGNAPLVEVLQYELRGAGGGGKAFVRDVKAYVRNYSKRPDLVPPEHVLIFDEAQRAFDGPQVARTHDGGGDGRSEPEHFIEFAQRVPDWCVVVGLIGSGQEIHTGEEGGIVQWRRAIEQSSRAADWTIHTAPDIAEAFRGMSGVQEHPALHLMSELRFHLATDVHGFVDELLSDESTGALRSRGERLNEDGYHFRITRDLQQAKQYLRRRYADDPDARFGMVASARDRDLPRFEVPNDFQSTKRVQNGPWFAEGEDDPRGRSCRELRTCVTEFGCQGLELDATLLAWGSDFVRLGGHWSNAEARRYQSPNDVRDPVQLRRNAYRVLLTRGRDATVVFVPPMRVLDATYAHLLASGFRELGERVGEASSGLPGEG